MTPMTGSEKAPRRTRRLLDEKQAEKLFRQWKQQWIGQALQFHTAYTSILLLSVYMFSRWINEPTVILAVSGIYAFLFLVMVGVEKYGK